MTVDKLKSGDYYSYCKLTFYVSCIFRLFSWYTSWSNFWSTTPYVLWTTKLEKWKRNYCQTRISVSWCSLAHRSCWRSKKRSTTWASRSQFLQTTQQNKYSMYRDNRIFHFTYLQILKCYTWLFDFSQLSFHFNIEFHI